MLHRGHGQLDRECGATPEPGTHCGHGASVKLDEVPYKGEPDTEPGVPTRRSGIDLSKPLEDVWELVRRDPFSGVADRDLDVGICPLQVELHSSSARRELHRIHEEIPRHLLQTAGISHDRSGTRIEGRFESDALGGRRRADRVEGGLEHRRDIQWPYLEAHVTGDHPRDVEQVFDELHLGRRVPQNGLRGMARRLGVELARRRACGPIRRLR